MFPIEVTSEQIYSGLWVIGSAFALGVALSVVAVCILGVLTVMWPHHKEILGMQSPKCPPAFWTVYALITGSIWISILLATGLLVIK